MTVQRNTRWLAALLAACLSAGARAEIPDPPDPSEQQVQQADNQVQWIQRLQEASNLLASGKAAEALKAFQSLQAEFPDLDTDGLVAMAIGDCQFNLQQYDQAKATYQQVQAQHPERAQHIWIRLTEVDMAMGKPAAAEASLQQIMNGTDNNETKSWAALRLATVQERQAIAALQQAQAAYAKACDIKTEGISVSTDWAQTHAEDLKDAIQQLQTALGQFDRNLQWTSIARGDISTVMPAKARVAKVQIAGTLARIVDGFMPQKDTVELTVNKDGKIEATIGGKKVEVDAAAQRQINRHMEQALRLLLQDNKDKVVSAAKSP